MATTAHAEGPQAETVPAVPNVRVEVRGLLGGGWSRSHDAQGNKHFVLKGPFGVKLWQRHKLVGPGTPSFPGEATSCCDKCGADCKCVKCECK